MSVSLYFGLPGSGKTTLACYHSIKGIKSGRYENIYTNIEDLCIPGVTYIPNEFIGVYHLCNCLLLIDEGTLFADSRGHRDFPKHQIAFFLLHRHYNCDIIIYTQQWDGIDKKIRVITDRVYYVHKSFLTGKWITKYYRIPYGIIIPDHKGAGSSEKLGEIIQGYSKPNIFVRLFKTTRIFRPKYYQYFDSWQHKQLKALPAQYTPYVAYTDTGRPLHTLKAYNKYKTAILLRSVKESFQRIPQELKHAIPTLSRRSGRYSMKER